MAAFKKSFLVLAVALLALACAGGTAYAQHPFGGLMTCVANAAPSLVRAEGIAELNGDIVLVCSVSSTLGLPATLTTNFNVTLNTNVTNNRDFNPPDGSSGGLGAVSRSSVTDAVLIVNEDTSLAPTATPNPNGTGQTPQYGVLRGNNGLAWNGVDVPVPGVGSNVSPTTIRFTNIRANVCQLGIPTGDAAFPSTQVVAFVSSTGTTNLSVTNNVLNIGTPLLGLLRTFTSTDPDLTLPIIAQQCVNRLSLPPTLVDPGGPVVDPNSAFSIRLSEGFATAFKTLGIPTNFPGLTQVEDGYGTPGSGVNNGGATQGTRFIIRFFNTPSGVRIFSPRIVTGTTSTTGGSTHTLTLWKLGATDANGAGAFSTSGASQEITITNGFGFVVYEVVDDNPFVIESVRVPITTAFSADTANDLPTVGTMQASVNFAPLSTVQVSDGPAPEPRFCDNSSPLSVFGIARCITNILFPFVTNQAGFDTGLVIANTSSDDKGTIQQAGNCTLYYFGGTTGGGANPPNQTSITVVSGKIIKWTLSGGNAAAGITGTPGFEGYIFALCNFQFAHGFAFISDGFGGVPTVAEGYLALVVPWNGRPGSRNGRNGESLGH